MISNKNVSLVTKTGDHVSDDSTDSLKVTIVGGAGSGGTSMTDDAAFTPGAGGITPAGGTYQATPDAVNDGDAGALRMTATRALYVTHETPAGDSMVDDVNDALNVNIVAGAGAGGTSSNFDAAVPSAGTAAGFSDGTNMVLPRAYDSNSGAGTEITLGVELRASGASGSVEAGTLTAPLRTDPTGTTTQPVSGTVTANAGTNLNTSALALEAGGNLATLAGAVDGTEVQVDVLTLPAVTGTVTANAGTNLNTSALALESGGNLATIAGAVAGVEMQVDIVSLPAVDTELTTADLDTGAGTDTRAVVGLVGTASGGGQLIPGSAADGLLVNLGANNDVVVSATNLDIRDLSAAQDSVAIHGDVGVVDQLDLTSANPLTVAIVDGDGAQITSFGGGTQYTEGATDASITGTAMLWEDTGEALATVSAATPLPVAIISGAGSGGTASDDDADFTAGTTAGTPAMGVYESTPTNVTDGDLGIVGITQGRRIKTSATVDAALPTGTNSIGQVTANAGTNLNTSALALETGGNLAGAATSLAILDDWDESDRAKVNIVAGQAGITAGAGAVGASTPRVTLASDDPGVALLGTIDTDTGNIATSAAVIDDWDESDRCKVNPIVGQAGVAAGAGAVGATVQRVTLASDDPGVALLGTIDTDTGNIATSVGLLDDAVGQSIFRSLDLDESEEEVKATAGTLYGWYIFNAHASALRYLKFYNATAATVEVGTTTPVLTIPIPFGAGANVAFPGGITFSTAITVAATTGVADNDTGAPGANEVIVNIFYK